MLLTRNNRLPRIIAILTTLILLVSGLSACGSDESLELRMDVASGVNSLDPQFATDPLACTLIANTMEGLMRLDGDGKPQPAGATGYTVSGDGTKYTFALRTDAKWSDGTDITADDYLFALRRLFDTQVPSPYADQYSIISNARQVLAGTLPDSALGVRATDSHTLEVTLTEPSVVLLDKLADTPAMPCNREFFDSTRARYGLADRYLIWNGPYVIDSWNNDKSIVLRANASYRQPPACPGVVFYTSRIVAPDGVEGGEQAVTALDLLRSGRNDIYLATAQQMETLIDSDITQLELENRVWTLGMNTTAGTLANEKLRRAMVMALDRDQYSKRVPEMYSIATALVPPSARPSGYRPPTLPAYDSRLAQQSAIAAHEEQGVKLGEDKLTLLVSTESELTALGGYLQKQWKDVLSLYVNMETLPEVELQARLARGDYTLALWQTDAATSDPASVLGRYTTASVNNYCRYSNEQYDRLLGDAAQVSGSAEALRLWESAEQLLMDSGVVSPLLGQSAYVVFGNGVSGVKLIGGRLNFAEATRFN